MSPVGPRPHVVDAVSSGRQLFTDLEENYLARQRVAPGMTGLAQISGWRGEIDDPEK